MTVKDLLDILTKNGIDENAEIRAVRMDKRDGFVETVDYPVEELSVRETTRYDAADSVCEAHTEVLLIWC